MAKDDRGIFCYTVSDGAGLFGVTFFSFFFLPSIISPPTIRASKPLYGVFSFFMRGGFLGDFMMNTMICFLFSFVSFRFVLHSLLYFA